MIPLRVARQTYDFDCGASALQVVMEYYGVEMRNDRIRRALKTDEHGTSYVDMKALAEKHGFTVFAEDNVTLEQLKKFIDDGYPAIVLVQAWAEKYMTLAEWRKNYEDGHYVVAIGYQDHTIVFEDPSSCRRTWLTEREFLARWHDYDPKLGRNLDHFVMVLMGRKPVIQASEHMD